MNAKQVTKIAKELCAACKSWKNKKIILKHDDGKLWAVNGAGHSISSKTYVATLDEAKAVYKVVLEVRSKFGITNATLHSYTPAAPALVNRRIGNFYKKLAARQAASEKKLFDGLDRMLGD